MTRTKRWLLVAGGVIVAFLVGFGWQFVRAHGLQNELDRTRRDLAAQRLEATLGAATIEAQRGQFEPARRLASDYFTGLQAFIDNAPETARPALQQILQQRDQVITELSRSDAQVVTTLSGLFVEYRGAVGEALAAPAGTESAPAGPASTTTG